MVVWGVSDNPYDFSDLVRDLKEQGIDAYDVFQRHRSFDDWCNRQGYGQKDPVGKHRGSSQVWFAEYQADPLGAGSEPPHANLWHFFLDAFDGWPWKTRPGCQYKDVVVTQKIIDKRAWVAAILAPIVARHGGKLRLRLSVDR